VAVPGVINIVRESTANGNVTNYEFEVETTNFITSGDRIYITLPEDASFSEDTACLGRSNNLDNTLDCTTSVNLRKLLVTVRLSEWLESKQTRRLQARNLGQIQPGELFKFRVTGIKNPPSYRPTDSMIY
jgi:hypothetical protein